MNLYINVENDQPIGHPAFEQNLLEVFGEIPQGWELFLRVKKPALEEYQTLVSETPTYEKIDGVWMDVWRIRDMTSEERIEADKAKEAQRLQKIEIAKATWANRPFAANFSAWVFNEEKIKFEPPIPRPDDGKFYRWSGPDNNWKEAEPFPDDGKRYEFDFDNWVNVEVTSDV